MRETFLPAPGSREEGIPCATLSALHNTTNNWTDHHSHVIFHLYVFLPEKLQTLRLKNVYLALNIPALINH